MFSKLFNRTADTKGEKVIADEIWLQISPAIEKGEIVGSFTCSRSFFVPNIEKILNKKLKHSSITLNPAEHKWWLVYNK